MTPKGAKRMPKTKADMEQELKALRKELDEAKALQDDQQFSIEKHKKILDAPAHIDFCTGEDGPMLVIYTQEQNEFHRFYLSEFEVAKLAGALEQHANSRATIL